MSFQNKSSGVRNHDNRLRFIDNNCWTSNLITDFKCVENINIGVLVTSLEVYFLSRMFLGSIHFLSFQFLKLLIDRFLWPLETLPNSPNSNIINKDIPIRQRKSKFLLMSLHKTFSEIPTVIRFNNHQRSISPLIPHIQVQLMSNTFILKSLLF